MRQRRASARSALAPASPRAALPVQGAGQLSIANLEGAGVSVPTLPSGGSIAFTVVARVTAAGGSVTNAASVTAPNGGVNSGTSCVSTASPAITRSFSAPTCTSTDIDTVAAAPTGSIGNFVWSDLNNNGLQEFDEPGLPGAPLTISGANLPPGYVKTVTADSNGAYQFSGLPAGTYAISLLLAPGYQSSPTAQGTSFTTCPAAASRALSTATATPRLPARPRARCRRRSRWRPMLATIRRWDFGLYSSGNVVNSGTGSIGNFVWFDANANGIQDAGEPGLPGIVLKIVTRTAEGVSSTDMTTTDANGRFLFTVCCPARMKCRSVSSAYVPTVAGRAIATTTCPDGTWTACDSNTSPTTVVLGGLVPTDLSVDFGLVAPPDSAQRVDQTCRGTLTGVRVTGNLKVAKNEDCTLISVTVQGDIQADEAGDIVLNGVSVGRNVDLAKLQSVPDPRDARQERPAQSRGQGAAAGVERLRAQRDLQRDDRARSARRGQ